MRVLVQLGEDPSFEFEGASSEFTSQPVQNALTTFYRSTTGEQAKVLQDTAAKINAASEKVDQAETRLDQMAK